MDILRTIAQELDVNIGKVQASVALLDEGATVPFIARYRKEATGGLDDTQLRTLQERLIYLRELEERRGVVLNSIEEQGKLTDVLRTALLEADTKTRLEDLYAPYKPKRRTKAQIAREAGIEPLLDALLAGQEREPEQAASAYLNAEAGFEDAKAVLDGARQIFMERVAEEADLLAVLRERLWSKAILTSSVIKDQELKGNKFSDYFEFSEAVSKLPSHRILALFRGRSEGVLRLKLQVPGQDDLDSPSDMGVCDRLIAQHFQLVNQGHPTDAWLLESVRWAWRVKVFTQLDTELKLKLKEQAEQEAIRVFGENLRDLLLAAPAGACTTMGLDPGIRTGVKVVVVDATGRLLDATTIYPHAPKHQWDGSIATLAKLVQKFKVELISIGNGTASRETDKLVKDLLKLHPDLGINSLVVSEAGASIYSASAYAAQEFPDLDVSLRGAVSIARRLQDPLAELVKIEPKSIGVGQYQHDVNQTHLARKLDAVVEDCVNAVGVEINTASVPLLTRVAGLSETLAQNIVQFREANGAFVNRKQLLKVPRLGPKAFEQSAGFLRIREGEDPLDASAVHPEAYPVVKKILAYTDVPITKLLGNSPLLNKLPANDFIDEQFGLPTVQDIIQELDKPGRDPRPEFKTAVFQDGIDTVADLKSGMIMEGVITNVTNFGAFVDIGVHQDGLVHISALSEQYVRDPREVVKAGDIVKVKVMEVDVQRKRIGLTMRLTDDVQRSKPAAHKAQADAKQTKPKPNHKRANKVADQPRHVTAMAHAFGQLKDK